MQFARSPLWRSCLFLVPLIFAAGAFAGVPIDIGPAQEHSRVPEWNAAGMGPLPWQGISCVDLTPVGNHIAVGTMAPLGDPNCFLLDAADGSIIEQHAVGQRWIGEIAAFGNGPGYAAICTSPTGAAEDPPALFRLSPGEAIGSAYTDFKPLLFQYGEHSNHYARSFFTVRGRMAISTAEGVLWSNAGVPERNNFLSRHGFHDARISAFAAGMSGRAVVGAVVNAGDPDDKLKNLAVMDDQKPTPVWTRSADDAKDVSPAPPLVPGLYGPHTTMVDTPVLCPLSVAIDNTRLHVASEDYQGYERFVMPRTPDEKLRPLRSIGLRFTPTLPTIHVYDDEGKLVQKFAPSVFEKPFWADLAFTGDGTQLIAYPHHWQSRGLAGQPCLPADDDARTLYILGIRDGDVRPVHFPDAISDVATGGALIAIGCWNGRVYLLNGNAPQNGVDVGAASLVKVSYDGKSVLAATATGVLHMLGADGHEIWKNDLAQTATHGEKPWTRADRVGSKIGPGVWRNNTGRAQSDLGNQIVIEAPDGLLLVDPNSGHSFEQNWATIRAEGLDPMKVKYILPTHEHGDHAPGSYLWRVITGAKVIASPEMAYTLQHDLPYTSGYGFHPPVPVDILVDHDQEMDLCGLKVKVLRLPGHTYGSMGCCFEMGGRRYVTLGDLIMPDGPLGYSGSVNFWPADVLASLKKLDTLKPDYVLCGHGDGTPDHFISAGIRAGEATGWGKMIPPNPDPFFGFANRNYQAVGWLEEIYCAAFGDIDGDGLTDIAILTPGEKGVDLEIFLNHAGHFSDKPDKVINVPGIFPAMKLRIDHLTAGKTADFMVSSEQAAVLLLADANEKLTWHSQPIVGATRAATFTADRTLTPPQCVIGQRFVQGCRLVELKPDGTVKTTDGPKMAKSAMSLKLVDLNGDGRSDLVTAGGEVFLRGTDGKLPPAASFTLDRPYGDWTFLAVGDFNGDGKPDIVQVGMAGVHAMAAVFYNTGDAAKPFHQKPDAELDLGLQLDHIRDGPTVADYTGDGIDDLILGHSQRQDILIIPGSRNTGLDRKNAIHVKVDYRLHYDTQIGAFDLNGKHKMSLASFGYSMVGAGGVYIRLPDIPEQPK